jgi:GH15 family glucan-1,4-alpha-glucosidase
MKNRYRNLTHEEEKDFRRWARENWEIGSKVIPIWHPIVRQECAKMLDEDITANIELSDDGTLDTVVRYKNALYRYDTAYRYDFPNLEEFLQSTIEDIWESVWDELIEDPETTKRFLANFSDEKVLQ